MRKLIAIPIFMIVAACGAPVSDADEAGSDWGKITELYVDAEVTVLRVRFSRDVVNPAGCEGADFYIRELDGSAASEQFLRIVVAAHLAERSVEFWINGCTQAQWWGMTRPHIYDIYIR